MYVSINDDRCVVYWFFFLSQNTSEYFLLSDFKANERIVDKIRNKESTQIAEVELERFKTGAI